MQSVLLVILFRSLIYFPFQICLTFLFCFLFYITVRFKVSLVEGHVYEEFPDVVMRSRHGININVEERKQLTHVNLLMVEAKYPYFIRLCKRPNALKINDVYCIEVRMKITQLIKGSSQPKSITDNCYFYLGIQYRVSMLIFISSNVYST